MNSITLTSLTKSFIKPCPHVPSIPKNRHLRSVRLLPIRSNSGDPNKATSSDGGNASPPPMKPPDTVELRFRRGSRRRSRRRQEKQDRATNGMPPKKAEASAPKDWESMTLTEKAMELYMGEKGLLFWLNKFAYASIFIIIGTWILFRFVGPALNLYQLDSPPLSPTSMFKG